MAGRTAWGTSVGWSTDRATVIPTCRVTFGLAGRLGEEINDPHAERLCYAFEVVEGERLSRRHTPGQVGLGDADLACQHSRAQPTADEQYADLLRDSVS